MSALKRSPKTTTSKDLVDPKSEYDLVGQLAVQAQWLKSRSETSKRSTLDIPKLEKAIARYRQAIALQTQILDELEAEINEIKRNARKRKPAKSKRRK